MKSLKTNFDTIFSPPLDTSGDAYHIGAYLILCRILKKTVPQVVLFYDTDNTKAQAKRGKYFLLGLGFANVRVEEIESECYQSKSRLKKSAQAVKSYSTRAVDQKVTTSLLSFAMLLYGDYVTANINEHISDIALKKAAVPAYLWAASQAQETVQKLNLIRKNFIIVSIRVSDKTNAAQAFSTDQVRTISKLLAKKGFSMILLDVGGSFGKKFLAAHKGDKYADSVAINVFPNVSELPKKYEKFPHLFLLQQLARLPTCRGVIGNTSGTLDIAAFMGLRTLCMHHFKTEGKNNIIVPYQDLRILLQTSVMSVYDSAVGLEYFAYFIALWLNTKMHLLCDRQTQYEKITIEDKKFRDHFDRNCFVFDVSKKVANPAFLAQFRQLKCNQKLSASMIELVESEDRADHKPSSKDTPIRSKYSKDDTELTLVKRVTRGRRMSLR